MNELTSKKVMTTKEVAEALGLSERVIRKHAQKLGITRNGVRTLITEKEATIIKNIVEKSGRNDLAQVCQLKNVSTESEENEIVMQALHLKTQETNINAVQKLQKQSVLNYSLKADYADTALKTENQMSITDAGKTLGIRQSVMFEFFKT